MDTLPKRLRWLRKQARLTLGQVSSLAQISLSFMSDFDGPYLELFARQQWPGWDVWGNEAGKFPAQTFLIPEQMLEAAS